jgi:hypothetical protein
MQDAAKLPQAASRIGEDHQPELASTANGQRRACRAIGPRQLHDREGRLPRMPAAPPRRARWPRRALDHQRWLRGGQHSWHEERRPAADVPEIAPSSTAAVPDACSPGPQRIRQLVRCRLFAPDTGATRWGSCAGSRNRCSGRRFPPLQHARAAQLARAADELAGPGAGAGRAAGAAGKGAAGYADRGRRSRDRWPGSSCFRPGASQGGQDVTPEESRWAVDGGALAAPARHRLACGFRPSAGGCRVPETWGRVDG